MIGGDLKFHLNREQTFDEERSKLYAAEVLLGLQHIHEKGIIYRSVFYCIKFVVFVCYQIKVFKFNLVIYPKFDLVLKESNNR